MTPQKLAEKLSSYLLAEGRFDASPIRGSSSLSPASTNTDFPLSEVGFSGLSVQSVGYEVGSGIDTVHIYVSNGSSKSIQAVNQEMEGIKVKANKMASLKINPQLTARSTNRGNLYLRNNRIACGSSCAPSSEQYSGTFGALVKDQNSNIYALSNNHVLAACNHVQVGMPILSPSSQDSHPSLPAPREIARHFTIVELRSGVPHLVPTSVADAALAIVNDTDIVTSWQGDSISGFDTPSSIAKPFTGMRVKKWGRTTRLTTGILESRLVMLPLPYRTNHFTATVYFTDVWTIRAENGSFALPGDSGSLVVTEDGNDAVGLVFATTTTETHNYGVIVTMDNIFGNLSKSTNSSDTFSLVDEHNL